MNRSKHTGVSQPDTPDDPLADPLTPEDRMLWETVARCVHPISLRQGRVMLSSHAASGKTRPLKAKRGGVPKAGQSLPGTANGLHAQHVLDNVAYRKIARGRQRIEARVDLHGLTQGEAYSLLLHFLQSAHRRGLRHVLVITGKGGSSGSDGVLRQAAPHWLATAPFRLHVSAFVTAAPHHGGNGALYIRLRRLPPGGAP